MPDPLVRCESQEAACWLFLAIFSVFLVLLAQPFPISRGALGSTSIRDGGTRWLGRILPSGRCWRLTVIILALFCFLGWTIWLTGSQLSAQASAMQQII